MAFISAFSVALQMLAAFVIFVFGYLALFVFLFTCVVAARVLYRGATWVRACARSVPARPIVSADVEIPAHREKRFVIPVWR